MKFIKKYWLVILTIITILRLFWSYNLPTYFINNLKLDDRLMIDNFTTLMKNEYLGPFSEFTLIKGIVFPITMLIAKSTNISYSLFYTFLYIFACAYFTCSLRKIVDDKKVLSIIYIFLLFNPISYSSELFQRLYRNSISISELLFLLGITIRIIKENKIVNYILFGITMTIMFLTREDNIWIFIILLIISIYKFYKNKKSILLCLIPMAILIINLNIYSAINYNHYGIYTYNVIQKSEFNKTFMKILKIKENKKYDKVAINKDTLYKLSKMTKTFNLSKEDIDTYYKMLADENGEINNGNIIWYMRKIIDNKNHFKTGCESEKYYKKLGKEIDKLFEEKELKSEFILPSIYIYLPTGKEIKQLPKYILKSISYTSTYQNVKTIDKLEDSKYKKNIYTNRLIYLDYNNTEKIAKKNPIRFEIIRIIYKYFTIIFSIISLIIYIKNIKTKDKLNLLIHIILITYLLILFGVTYTHVTAFPAIRYFYLGNVYILQNLFILLNISRFISSKKMHN